MTRFIKSAKATALLGAAAAVLAACASTNPPAGADLTARLPTEQFPIDLVPAPDEIRLAAHPEGLSGPQQDALGDFAMRWREAGASEIVIQSPRGGNEPAAMRASAQARNFLIAMGARPDQIRLTAYQGSSDAPDVIVVGYQRYQAMLPTCGTGWDNLSATASNQVSSNFGCAVSANLAAQVDNPTDLARPRGLDPADAGRRMTVIDKYRKGEKTGAEHDEQASGAVSNAVK